MGKWVPPEKRPQKPPPPDWKPARCACGAKHPSFSLNGMEGPWMCGPCAKATEPGREPTVFEKLYAGAAPPAPPTQQPKLL